MTGPLSWLWLRPLADRFSLRERWGVRVKVWSMFIWIIRTFKLKLFKVPHGNHSLLMLLCQIFKFFSNIIFNTAPLVVINNFNSLVIALIAPLMLLFGHIQGQQLTGYLLAGYLFISSNYVSLLTPLLGPTGLHINLILLAFITFYKSSVRVRTVRYFQG